MSKPAFNLPRALANWRFLYPNPEERIQALRGELSRCHGSVRDFRGQRVSREYPRTKEALERMLEAELEAER